MDILCAEFKELGIDKEDCDVVLLCSDNEFMCKLENISKRFLLLTPDSRLKSPSYSLLADALLQAGEKCLKCLRKSENIKEHFSFVVCLLQMSTNVLKMLRNSFARNMLADINSKKLGCFLAALKEALGDILSCLGIFKDEINETLFLSRCCLQVVANFASSGVSNSKESLRMFSGNLVDFICSEVKDQRSKVYATAALHMSLVHSVDALSDLKLHSPTCNIALLTQKLLSTLVHDDGEERMESEWSLFVFKLLLKSSNYLEEVWESMSVKERIFTVEVLASECEFIIDQSTEPKHNLVNICHQSNLDFLCLELSDRMASFVKGEGQVTDAENCTHPLLDFLSQTSSCFHSLNGMKHTTSLLSQSTDLLNVLQSASKQKDNLAKEETILLSEIRRDLIRLISNLVYRNKEHQDLMRGSGGFSLILNMTTIDANCPTIQQWALFTINNLCEDNEENRKFISDLKLERVADVSQELKKAGVKVEVRNGKLHFLKPDEQEE